MPLKRIANRAVNVMRSSSFKRKGKSMKRGVKDGVKLMGVQIPLSIIAMPLRRAYALPGAIFLVSA